MRSANWIFTWNNYNELSIDLFAEAFEEGRIKYCVIGKEVGELGTPHLQGTVFFKQRISLNQLRGYFGTGPHWDSCRSKINSVTYCKKDGDWVEYGVEDGEQGKRSDLESGCDELLEHRDLGKFKLDHPVLWVKYPRGFGTLLGLPPRCPSKPPRVVWLYGPTGVGKTREVHATEPVLWVSNEDLRWFDGYNGEPAVLFDDFRADFCKFHTLLRYLDRYPVKVPVKGDMLNWAPDRIYITSCSAPGDVYNKSTEDQRQLLRRITEIKHIPFNLNT